MKKYKKINTPFIYYISPVVFLVVTIFLVFVGQEILRIGETWVGLITFSVSGLVFVWTGYYLNRFVYGTVDLDAQTLNYGNIFFRAEVPLHAIERTGSFFLSSSILEIKIHDRRFFIQTFDNAAVEALENRHN